MAENKIAEAFVEVRAKLDKLESDFEKGEKVTKKGIGKMQAGINSINFKAVGAGLLAVGAAVGVAIGFAVKAASDFEEAESKFKTVFGNLTDTAETWAKDLEKSFGVSSTEARQFLGSVQDLLVPMGVAKEQAANLSNEVVKLSVDLGSFNNLPTAQVMGDVQSALVGNFETMKKYGIVLNAATVEQKALELGLVDVGGELDAAAKAQAAFALITEGSAAATGDFQRTSGGFANSLKAMQAEVSSAVAIFGKEFLPVATYLINSFREGIPAIRDFALAIGGLLGPALQLIVDTGVSVIKTMAKFYGVLSNGEVTKAEERVQSLREEQALLDKQWKDGTIKSIDVYKKRLVQLHKATQDATAKVKEQKKAQHALTESTSGLNAKVGGLVRTFEKVDKSAVRMTEALDKTVNVKVIKGFEKVDKSAVRMAEALDKTVNVKVIKGFEKVDKSAIKLNDAIKETPALTRKMTGATASFFRGFNKGAGKGVAKFKLWERAGGKFAEGLKDILADVFTKALQGDLTTAQKAFGAFKTVVIGIVAKLAAEFVIKMLVMEAASVTSALVATAAWLVAAGPFILIGLAIAAVVYVIAEALKALQKNVLGNGNFSRAFAGIGKSFGKAIGSVVKQVTNLKLPSLDLNFDLKISMGGGTIGKLGDFITELVRNPIGALTGALKGLYNTIFGKKKKKKKKRAFSKMDSASTPPQDDSAQKPQRAFSKMDSASTPPQVGASSGIAMEKIHFAPSKMDSASTPPQDDSAQIIQINFNLDGKTIQKELYEMTQRGALKIDPSALISLSGV